MSQSLSNQPHLKFCALASGSKGNALYASDGKTSILFDAGLSGVEIQRRMEARGIRPESIDAIVVSHEHSDHIKGVGVLCRRFGTAAYFTKETWAAASQSVGEIKRIRRFSAGTDFTIGGLKIHAFSTSHDAADPVGFTVCGAGAKIGIATDLGVAAANAAQHLKDCGALLIEANHDLTMLVNGPYPWHLKQRIKGRKGHLSNEASRDMLAGLLHDRLTHVILGHLSQTNNNPKTALNVVSQALADHPAKLTAAHQDVCGEMIILKG